MYYSASGQDKWVLETLDFKRNGFFVDLGAMGGINDSNTYALEKDYNWTGICVENSQDHFESLITARTSSNILTTIYNYNGQCIIDENGKIVVDGTGTTVDCRTFDDIMGENGYNGIIDYMSVNIGGREGDVITSIDFSKYEFQLISVQTNIYKIPHKPVDEVFLFLWNNGYERMYNQVLGLDPTKNSYYNFYEDWYYNKKFISL